MRVFLNEFGGEFFKNSLVFNVTHNKNLIILDGSFEDNLTYNRRIIEFVINDYSKKYNKECIFYTMNKKIIDNKKIFYKNFCWGLYKDVPRINIKEIKYNFTYLCGYPRYDKLHMLSALFRENLLGEKTLWSCGSISPSLAQIINLPLPSLPKVLDYDKALKRRPSCWKEIQTDFFNQSNFSLVQETEMKTLSDRYTEKTFKCFWTQQPFIVAGNYQTLKSLREDGFKTFHPFINEKYDEIEDRDKRIQEIITQVKILNNKTKNEWRELRNNIKEILDYNFNHALNLKL